MKSVLVTGCSSGIGRCIAAGLQEKGYRVIATARKSHDLEQLEKEGFDVVQLDLTCSDSIQSAVKQLLEKTDGALYALVNNAAYGQAGAIEDLTRADLEQQFQTNVLGTQELTNLLIPVFRKQNEGRIIQISSVLGFITMRFRGAYCATKYALEALSDAMRYELQSTNIHVSLIEPGPIRSEFRSNMLSMYRNTIAKQNSPHQQDYAKIEREMDAEGYTVPFTLGPEAVLEKVIHALESNRPRARYFVTVPTYLFALLKRLLPGNLLDKILRRL